MIHLHLYQTELTETDAMMAIALVSRHTHA